MIVNTEELNKIKNYIVFKTQNPRRFVDQYEIYHVLETAWKRFMDNPTHEAADELMFVAASGFGSVQNREPIGMLLDMVFGSVNNDLESFVGITDSVKGLGSCALILMAHAFTINQCPPAFAFFLGLPLLWKLHEAAHTVS